MKNLNIQRQRKLLKMSKNTKTSHTPQKVIFVCDGTSSMGSYFLSLGQAFPQIVTMLKSVFGNKINVGFAVYHDFDINSPRRYIGGFACDFNGTVSSCEHFIKTYLSKVSGGSSFPEAQRTAFNMLLNTNDLFDIPTLIIHCTDAPPHGFTQLGNNEEILETKYLKIREMELNWWVITTKLNSLKNVQIVTLSNNRTLKQIYFPLGGFLYLGDFPTISNITETIIKLIFNFYGEGEEFTYGYKYFGKHIKRIGKGFDLKKIRKDETKYQQILEAFELLLKTQKGALSLTTYPFFGKLWRLICGKISKFNNDYSERSEILKKKISLYSQADSKIKQWIKNSYDSTEELLHLFEPRWKIGGYQYVIQSKTDITREQLMDLLRSVNQYNFHSIMTFLAKIEIIPITEPFGDFLPKGVPIDLSVDKIFRCVSHLIFPGTMLKQRGSLILASLCLGIAPLSDKAKDYLILKKGKWINFVGKINQTPSVPENWSYGFMTNIMSQLVSRIKDNNDFLTNKELEIYHKCTKLIHINRQWFNIKKLAKINIKTYSKTSSFERVPDYKLFCEGCNQYRSKTIMATQKQCGICYDSTNNEYLKYPDLEMTTSFMVCCGECNSHYAIYDPECLDLINPKCYFCRLQTKIKQMKCSVCKRKYVNSLHVEKKKDWMCAVCDYNKIYNKKNGFSEIKITTIKLINGNPFLLKLIGIKDLNILKKITNLNLFRDYKTLIIQEPKSIDEISNIVLLDGRPVLNVKDTCSQLMELFNTHSGKETCYLCFGDYHSSQMTFSCGHCSNRICNGCAKSWYKQTTCGNVVNKTWISCPFCKCEPIFKIWSLGGKYLRQLRHRHKYGWEPSQWHAWCIQCSTLCPAMPKTCSTEKPEFNGNFKCEKCVENSLPSLLDEAKDFTATTKKCPNCEITTQHAGGCNHMTCPSCNIHWCWTCCGIYSEENIYDHMEITHGGIYGDGVNAYEYEEEDYIVL